MLPIATYNLKAILEGTLSLLPGGLRLFTKGTRGTDSARYCYSVWLRHLVKTQELTAIAGGRLGTVVELGPGDSLGTGLAALLCGAEKYIAIDAVEHADRERNLRIFEDLVGLFRVGAPIPDQQELPQVLPLLDDYAFPNCIRRGLRRDRLDDIAAALRDDLNKKSLATYVNAIEAPGAILSESVDLIFSQAVLEHVDDLDTVYTNCFAWLRPGGIMSHQIDFKSHGTSREWNGHWAYPDSIWRLIRGKRPYLINRQPCGTHLEALAKVGFVVLSEERTRRSSRLTQGQLARAFRGISTDDLTTAGVYLITKKMGSDRVP